MIECIRRSKTTIAIKEPKVIKNTTAIKIMTIHIAIINIKKINLKIKKMNKEMNILPKMIKKSLKY